MTQGDKKQINTSLSHMVRQGATAFAVIAGLIAMGTALVDKKTRRRLVKGTQNVLNAVGSAASNMTEQAGSQYRAVAHRIRRGRGKITKRRKQENGS